MQRRSIPRSTSLVLSLALGTGALVFAPSAHAGLDACGDIYVEAEATCVVEVEGGCETKCEPIRMEAACAAELEVECAGECNASASLDCRADCSASCEGQCEVDPGEFDCSAACTADCAASCDASCSSGDSECRASCEATCSGRCDARCEGTPPSASCEARCEASCEGSCEARANVDCQIDCQADGFAECKVDLQGGCEARCERPEGALFCDGQYVDHGNNLKECIAALEQQLDIAVDVRGSAEAECDNGTCEASAEGAIACAVDPEPRPVGALWATALLGIGAWLRRRRA